MCFNLHDSEMAIGKKDDNAKNKLTLFNLQYRLLIKRILIKKYIVLY